jgi:hypothetical protein
MQYTSLIPGCNSDVASTSAILSLLCGDTWLQASSLVLLLPDSVPSKFKPFSFFVPSPDYAPPEFFDGNAESNNPCMMLHQVIFKLASIDL